ncbi:MAG: hypothetical protein ACE5H4_15310 [Candidatus Thorarchaeota archaeon]
MPMDKEMRDIFIAMKPGYLGGIMSPEVEFTLLGINPADWFHGLSPQ